MTILNANLDAIQNLNSLDEIQKLNCPDFIKFWISGIGYLDSHCTQFAHNMLHSVNRGVGGWNTTSFKGLFSAFQKVSIFILWNLNRLVHNFSRCKGSKTFPQKFFWTLSPFIIWQNLHKYHLCRSNKFWIEQIEP